MNLFTFSKHFKHVDIYLYDGKYWIGFRMGSDGVTYAVSGFTSGMDLINKALKIPEAEALIAVDIFHRAYFGWQGITIPMCNELARALSGLDIGFTWNPGHLYRKLLKYDGERNYEIFYQWRRDDGFFWWG